MESRAERVVLAIDPGREKCGVAVCRTGRVLERTVAPTRALAGLVADWHRRHSVTEIVVGNRTGSSEIVKMIGAIAAVPIRPVEEWGTTLMARARYFAEHPPRGWRRLVPAGLQTPPEPYDDYAAVLLAERALAEVASGDTAEAQGEDSATLR